ncbi:MAG: T9SS type A sorting domain-containing protein [Prevotellaceae bacterium]|jgi:hypothetical protein|nr:T9SS type A sorting domain-containing protein [Prevotellaceae bacterium]
MKTFILFMGLTTAAAFGASSQALVYRYDASGNRIKRELENPGQVGSPAAPQSVSASTAEIALDADTATVKLSEPATVAKEPFRVEVYPNPTEGLVEIELPDLKKGEKGRIRIYSLQGATVYEKQSVQNRQSADISHCMPGIYALYVTVNNKTVMRTIIKL